jgi:predicted site-specific integrase-resolvase
MTQTPRKLISREQAAERAGVSPRTIDRWRRLGLLTTHTYKGLRMKIWIDPRELDHVRQPRLTVPAQKQGADA